MTTRSIIDLISCRSSVRRAPLMRPRSVNERCIIFNRTCLARESDYRPLIYDCLITTWASPGNTGATCISVFRSGAHSALLSSRRMNKLILINPRNEIYARTDCKTCFDDKSRRVSFNYTRSAHFNLPPRSSAQIGGDVRMMRWRSSTRIWWS